MNRRNMVKTVAVTGIAAGFPAVLLGQATAKSHPREAILTYLGTLARPDGGYGWEGQGHSHLTATFYVIGCYRLLAQKPPNRSALAEFIRTHHPGALKKLEQERRIFEFQQVQTLVWLGEDVAAVKEKILAWKQPLAYLKQYEQHGYPLFSSEMGVILSRALLGMTARELPQEFVAYLDSRRRTNGSFNNTPAADGSDGHVMNTWWGLRALEVLGRSDEQREETGTWLRECQLPNGAFTFAPKPEFGGLDDVAYSWAAVRALKQLGAKPVNAPSCVAYLHSLANSDGGFADRPGWLSNPMATYYALDALAALDALETISEAKRRPAAPELSLPSNLKIFSVQLEAHGQGSPMEAVDLAHGLRIHLWGAKNAKPGWLARAQAVADAQKVPVKFFVSNEEYGTWMNVPGLGTYSHTSDIVAPVGAAIGGSLGNQGTASWNEFRQKRLSPLEQAQGRLVWQFGENEELVRMFLDDSVKRGGYSAVSTYHFGNPDFTNSEPFLHRWRGQIPFVGLQDAHGPEPWWFSDMTTGFRTLFLATEPTWGGWLEALKNHRVIAVRHDRVSGGKTWMHAGSREVLEFVGARESEWRWWDNPDIQRPLVSIVAVRPEDEFETARPEKGVALRIRCAWENSLQGLLKQPITEFVKLIVDAQEVTPSLVAKKRPNGLFDDHYHYAALPTLKPGSHAAQVIVRVLGAKEHRSRELKFYL
jgi:hypothetical protein